MKISLAGGPTLVGDLKLPPRSRGLVVFAHGSGSSRGSPRNRFVAAALGEVGIGTLLADLLTPAEALRDALDGQLRFDIELLSRRLGGIVRWVAAQAPGIRVGLFGASTGAAAAIRVASVHRHQVAAVVSRGGRPDLAYAVLPMVLAPTLLIVGGADRPTHALNRAAFGRLTCRKRLAVVRGAGHLFAEPGTLEHVANLTCSWFLKQLP